MEPGPNRHHELAARASAIVSNIRRPAAAISAAAGTSAAWFTREGRP
jgi:hypothetical protein